MTTNLRNKTERLLTAREDIAKELTAAILRGAAAASPDSRWRKAPDGSDKCPGPFWSPDGGDHYGFDAAGSARTAGGDFIGSIIDSTGARIDTFSAQVRANLFTRPLTSYKPLGNELKRYKSNIESVKPRR